MNINSTNSSNKYLNGMYQSSLIHRQFYSEESKKQKKKINKGDK